MCRYIFICCEKVAVCRENAAKLRQGLLAICLFPIRQALNGLPRSRAESEVVNFHGIAILGGRGCAVPLRASGDILPRTPGERRRQRERCGARAAVHQARQNAPGRPRAHKVRHRFVSGVTM